MATGSGCLLAVDLANKRRRRRLLLNPLKMSFEFVNSLSQVLVCPYPHACVADMPIFPPHPASETRDRHSRAKCASYTQAHRVRSKK